MAKRFLSARGVGKRESRNKGASLEFREYRHYVRGDELRYLDWNVYARHESLFVKEFTAEESVHVAILIDQSASMAPKFETAKTLALALGYIALANFDSVSVWRFSDRILSVRSFLVGKTRIHDLMGALEGLRTEGPSDFAKAFELPLPRLKGKSVAIVISDFYDLEGYAKAMLGLLAQKIQVDMIQVLTREEVDPKVEGRLLMRDSETGREREVFVSSKALSAYRSRYRQFLEDLDSFARAREIRRLRVFTDELLESIIARAAQGGFLERV
jgi:uncharacterized protein (DUF58 family)